MKNLTTIVATMLVSSTIIYSINGNVPITRKIKETIADSAIVYPRQNATVNSNPLIIGIVRNNKKLPVKNAKVLLLVDGVITALVKTNSQGAWSFKIQDNKALADGCHHVVALGQDSLIFLGSTSFNVKSSPSSIRSGNVDNTNSAIAYPYEDAFINSAMPIVVGFVNDSSFNPVDGETVRLTVDGQNVASVISDSNGMFCYALSESQALYEGTHFVDAYAVNSQVGLQANSFRVDVTPPYAPSITSPTASSTVYSNSVTVSGSTEPYALVMVFLDADTSGQSVTADAQGHWSIDLTIANGNHSITAQAQDIAFNTGPSSDAINFSVQA